MLLAIIILLIFVLGYIQISLLINGIVWIEEYIENIQWKKRVKKALEEKRLKEEL